MVNRKLLLCFFAALLVITTVINSITASERPPIDFSDRPLKLWVPFDPKKPGDLQNMKTNYVFISEKDLKEIEDAKNPTKTKADDPPVNYQLSSANFYATVKDDYITISGVYNINKLDDEWTLIPVISDQVGLASSFMNGNPAFMTTFNSGQDLSKFKNVSQVSRGYYYLALKDKGIHSLKINFSTSLSQDPSINTRSFTFSIPNVPLVNLHCTVNQKDLDFTVPQATSMGAKTVDNGTKLFASFPPVNKIEVKWNPKSSISKADEKNKQKLPPSISAITYNRIEIGRGTLKGAFTADIDIRHAAIDHFDFYIPKDIDIDSVIATNNVDVVDPSPVISKDGILAVDLTSPVEGKLTLKINYRKVFNNSSFVTAIPAITLANKNIDREYGFVGVAETTNIETNIVESNNESYTLIDSKDLTGPLSGMNASIAFKYLKIKDTGANYPYTVSIDVVRHEDVAVYEATINSTNITSVMNEEGQILTKATMQVRNTTKQFLNIQLPKNSDIWSVYVDNRAAKPAITDKEKNIYSIPLAKSSDSEDGGKTFPVEIVYMVNKQINFKSEGLKFLEKPLNIVINSFGFNKFKALSTELDSNSIKWELYLPADKKFIPLDIFSNLKKADTPELKRKDRRGSGLFGGMTMNKMAEVGQVDETFQTQQEAEMPMEQLSEKKDKSYKAGREEYQQMAPAPPASLSSIEGDSVSDYNYKSGIKQKWRQQMPFKSKKIGNLPVYVYLPITGKSYNFYQISFQKDQFPSVSTFFVNKKMFGFLALAIIAILVGIMITPAMKKEFKTPRFAIPATLLAVVLIALYGWGIIWFAVWLTIILAILFALYKLVLWFIKQEKPRQYFVLKILAVIILVLALFIILLIIDSIRVCFGVLLLLIGLAIVGAFLYGIYRLIMWKWPPKQKHATDKEVETNLPDMNTGMEGHENE
jgi:hypothetical protein